MMRFAFARLVVFCSLAPSLGGCEERVIYVYADANDHLDASTALADARGDGSGDDDAWMPADGTCLPNRSPGSISSADCHRYASTPVCDAFTATCAPTPSAFCDPCEVDAQCQSGVDLRARCVFLSRPAPYQSDQACLSPCTTVDDCAFLGWPATSVRCVAVGSQGMFCDVPFADGTVTCSDGIGGRR